MIFLEFLPTAIGFILCGLAIIHAFFDGESNRLQRFLFLATLFLYGILLEYIGIISGQHYYAAEAIMLLEVVPLSIPLAWVGIIYSVMIIGEHLELSLWMRTFTISLIALSLDWGMDPIAVKLGLWTWVHEGGNYFGIPSFNFIGWLFIPIAYLIAYNLNWNEERKRLELLSITVIDNHNSIGRKLYTLFLVVPIALLLLIIMGLITLIPIIYNLPLIIVIFWEVFTVIFSLGIIIIKRYNLRRIEWFDIIPPTILLFIAYSYAIIGFFTDQIILAIHMLVTGIPFLLALVFSVKKKEEINKS